MSAPFLMMAAAVIAAEDDDKERRKRYAPQEWLDHFENFAERPEEQPRKKFKLSSLWGKETGPTTVNLLPPIYVKLNNESKEIEDPYDLHDLYLFQKPKGNEIIAAKKVHWFDYNIFMGPYIDAVHKIEGSGVTDKDVVHRQAIRVCYDHAKGMPTDDFDKIVNGALEKSNGMVFQHNGASIFYSEYPDYPTEKANEYVLINRINYDRLDKYAIQTIADGVLLADYMTACHQQSHIKYHDNGEPRHQAFGRTLDGFVDLKHELVKQKMLAGSQPDQTIQPT